MTDQATEQATTETEGVLPPDHPLHPLTTPVGNADPFPTYHRMLAEPINVHDSGLTLVSRYDDATAVLRHPRAGSDDRATTAFTQVSASGRLDTEQRGRLNRRSFLHLDPPDHTRLRRLAASAFTPKVVAGLRPEIQRIVDDAVDAAAPRGGMDVVQDLAFPLPVRVICELLGVPAEDHLRFEEWSRPQLCCNAEATADGGSCPVQDDLDQYFDRMVNERRVNPGDDLLSALIAAGDGEDRLTHDEIVATARLLFVAGHETTVSLVANGVLALLRAPDQFALLRAPDQFALLRAPDQFALLRGDPGLAGDAVEETLRYDAPFPFVTRVALDDLEINGTTIPRDSTVLVWLAAAGRDPRRFADPDTFDITRADKRHLGFGGGIHACLGGALAKAQGEIALATLARRLVNPRLGAGGPSYQEDAVHAIKHLPITFDDTRPAGAHADVPAMAGHR